MSFQSTGLSITTSLPITRGTGTIDDTLGFRVEAYQHELRVLGGYWKATIKLKGNQQFIDEWVTNGLGRDIEVFNEGLDTIFNGFVNKISADNGPVSVDAGPFLDINNRVSVIYAVVDDSVVPNVVGNRDQTDDADDTESQGLYGIHPIVINGGELTVGEATQLRDTWLAAHRYPVTSRSLSLDANSSSPSLTLEVLGYWHWLNYIYNDLTNVGTVTADSFIKSVLNADPNSLLNDITGGDIQSNSVTVSQFTDNNKKAGDLIKSTVALGGATNNRFTFGIYKDRRPHYAPQSGVLYYQFSSRDPASHIRTMDDSLVRPWNVRPGRWIIYPDYMIGSQLPTLDELYANPSCEYIETVRYTAPLGLVLPGSRFGELDQKLAKYGVSGTS